MLSGVSSGWHLHNSFLLYSSGDRSTASSSHVVRMINRNSRENCHNGRYYYIDMQLAGPSSLVGNPTGREKGCSAGSHLGWCANSYSALRRLLDPITCITLGFVLDRIRKATRVRHEARCRCTKDVSTCSREDLWGLLRNRMKWLQPCHAPDLPMARVGNNPPLIYHDNRSSNSSSFG
jgi:hypothetical protein